MADRGAPSPVMRPNVERYPRVYARRHRGAGKIANNHDDIFFFVFPEARRQTAKNGCVRGTRVTPRDARTAFRTPRPRSPIPIPMRALRVAAALCVVLLAAGAEAGAALNKSPFTDASLLRESLLVSKATKRANEAARAVRANGADGLFDGIFADARQHLPPGKRSADAVDDADATHDADASRLRLSAAQRRLLWGGWRDNANAAAAPAPAPADASVSAMGGTTADHTSGDAADHASAPAPAPAANITSTPRGFLANALLLNRLRAVLAGEEGAARSLVASAALTSALRNLDPATSLFGRIVEDVAARREEAQQESDTDTNIDADSADRSAPAPAPADAAYERLDARVAEAISAAFRDAADDRARELLAELFLARLGATGVSVDADDADDGTEGTLLERLDLATLEGLSAAEIEAQFGAALDAGFEGMRLADVLAGSRSGSGSGPGSGPSGAEQQRLAAEAYRALFAASLDAAGEFVKERFDGGGGEPHSLSGGTNLTGADLNALLSATVEAAEANAASFVDLGFGPGSDLNATGDGSPADLSPETAVALLDRVHGVLAVARGDFTAALAEARDAEGAPLAWPGVAPGDDAETERRGFLSAAEIVALVGGARFAQDASLRDVGVAFTVSDDGARLGDLEALDDAFVDAMSGPSASETPNAAASAADGVARKTREKPVHERVGFQVGFPVAVVALAAIAVAIRASGHGDRAFAAAARPVASGPDATAGASTAVASGSGSVVRRTSTSTKIEM